MLATPTTILPDYHPDLTKLTNTPKPEGRKPYQPEGSQKRQYSPGTSTSPTNNFNEEKRQRQGSGEFDTNSTALAGVNMEPEPTLADIMEMLKITAKVSNLDNLNIKIQATVSSQALEIQELREDLTTQSKRIQALEDSLGQQTARLVDRTYPEPRITRYNQHGAPSNVNIRSDDRRRNLVFEGIPNQTEPEIVGYIIQVCSSLDILAFASDIECVIIMKRRDQTSSRPPPVLVIFNQLHVRSALLRKKVKLAGKKFSEVFINPDEPFEVRRNKAAFRQIAFKARQDGKSVEFRDDYIKIDDEMYTVADLDKVPDMYKPTSKHPVPHDPAKDEGATGGATPPDSMEMSVPNHPPKEQPQPRRKTHAREKIKLTRAGYTYSGPSAFLSHMYRCNFVYSKTPYTSVEQGYHHTHATQALDFEVAETIMDLTNAHEIKIAAKNLPDSVEWGEMGPGVLWELNLAKFSQNPDLKQRLLETAPHPLVEASVDSKWGGGCPYGSDIYDQGQVPGKNIAGKQLTKQRDEMIEEQVCLQLVAQQ